MANLPPVTTQRLKALLKKGLTERSPLVLLDLRVLCPEHNALKLM
ncbi:hypothetical protein [Nostoc sp. T09]|nr:hypothetical protein [Nostoc sp. T09]